jgi:ABC-type nitrate/sulfonate/bicarbonate transport system substrate-binding protein
MAGTTLLTNLRLSECSVVDAPANELEGWLLMKSAKGIEKEQRAFAKLLADIRDTADWTDEQKIEAARKAVDACPPQIVGPVLEEAALAAAIRKQYGLDKRDDVRHPENGRFIPRAEAVQPKPAEKSSLIPWRLGGAVHPALRNAN